MGACAINILKTNGDTAWGRKNTGIYLRLLSETSTTHPQVQFGYDTGDKKDQYSPGYWPTHKAKQMVMKHFNCIYILHY